MRKLNAFTGLESFHCGEILFLDKADALRKRQEQMVRIIEQQLNNQQTVDFNFNPAAAERIRRERLLRNIEESLQGNYNYQPRQEINYYNPISYRNHDLLEVVPNGWKNRTIKRLQLMKGSRSTEIKNQTVFRLSRHFVALETVVFLEPEYSLIRVSDLPN